MDDGFTPQRTPNDVIHVAVLTTSFPIVPGSTSGIFVSRLFAAMPATVAVTILTPASRLGAIRLPEPEPFDRVQIRTVRYAPNSWQRLAHEPGGLPIALRMKTPALVLLPLLIVSLALATLRIARTHQILHANWAANGCIAGIAGFLARRPVLVSLRGEDVTRARVSPFSGMVLRLALALGNSIVAVSTDMAAWLKTKFPNHAHKIVVVENGVDERFLAIGAVRYNRPVDTTPILTCVGNLIPRKGHDVLLRALGRCNEYRWKLRLAGDGPERGHLSALARTLGLSDRIEFIGEILPDAMPDFLAEGNVFILPSLSEGRPNALVEAMAAGLPVVASAIDGVTELVEDGRTGQLFPAGDDGALADVLAHLMQHPSLRSKLGEAAHHEICERQLTWIGAAERYASLYRKMLEEI